MPVRTSTLEQGGLLRVVLDEPRGNVLSMAMMREILQALASNRDDGKLKLVALSGAGGNFSFGASVAEHRRETAETMLTTFHDLVREIASFPVPVAAVVEGRCLGGAFEVALACHFVLAAPTAVFACPEIKLGVLPPVLAVLGRHRLGGPLAERMLLTGSEIDARQAEACGFAVPLARGDEADLVGWYGKHLAPLSAFSLREATWAARHGSGLLESLEAPLDAAERRYLERLLPSHDANEGIEAFIAKRAPKWADA
jgi:cyclohexa-1,5-dienecarbonyl-CoA hydratase